MVHRTPSYGTRCIEEQNHSTAPKTLDGKPVNHQHREFSLGGLELVCPGLEQASKVGKSGIVCGVDVPDLEEDQREKPETWNAGAVIRRRAFRV